jgi:hypothetical protein
MSGNDEFSPARAFFELAAEYFKLGNRDLWWQSDFQELVIGIIWIRLPWSIGYVHAANACSCVFVFVAEPVAKNRGDLSPSIGIVVGAHDDGAFLERIFPSLRKHSNIDWDRNTTHNDNVR